MLDDKIQMIDNPRKGASNGAIFPPQKCGTPDVMNAAANQEVAQEHYL
jgi:hypothetical protein